MSKLTPVVKVLEIEGDEAVFAIKILVKNNLDSTAKLIDFELLSPCH